MSTPTPPTNATSISEQLQKGSCLCKAITYELRGAPVSRNVCHCSNCKKQTGTAFFSTGSYKQEQLNILSGQSSIKTYQDKDKATDAAGGSLVRQFCSECGSTLFVVIPAIGYVAVCMGTMDGLEEGWKPDQEFFTKDRLPWVKSVEGAMEHDMMPTGQ